MEEDEDQPARLKHRRYESQHLNKVTATWRGLGDSKMEEGREAR